MFVFWFVLVLQERNYTRIARVERNLVHVPTDMDGILRHHKNYHLSPIVGAGPDFVLDRVMGDKMNASKVGSFWNLLLAYMMKRIPNKD